MDKSSIILEILLLLLYYAIIFPYPSQGYIFCVVLLLDQCSDVFKVGAFHGNNNDDVVVVVADDDDFCNASRQTGYFER